MKSESWLSELMRREIALAMFALLLVLLWSVLSCAEIHKPDALAGLAWLRSALFDFDLYFGNEYKFLDQNPFQSYSTETGYCVNPLGVGTAILQLPFYLLGFIGTYVHNFNSLNPLPYDGLNTMFRQAAGLGGAVYGAAAILLSARIAACFASKRTALWAAMLIAAGTPLLYYSSVGSLYQHTAGAFLAALFIDRLLAEHKNLRHIIFAGLVGGLMLSTSLRCIFMLALLPLAWWLNRRWTADSCIAFAAALLLGFMPQMFVWQLIYGAPLPLGELLVWQGRTGFSPVQALFSSHHGMFIWSPLLIFSFVGFALLYKRQRLYALLLSAVCLAFVIVNSIFRPYDDFSFGARQMTACTPLFVTGLALFLRRIETFENPLLRVNSALALFVCTAWGLLLMGVFIAHMPDNEHINFVDIAEKTLRYIGGDAGVSGTSIENSMPASNGGRAMLLLAALLAMILAYLPKPIRIAVPVLAISAGTIFFCTLTFIPQDISKTMPPLLKGEWRNWQRLTANPGVGQAYLNELALSANKARIIKKATELRCRLAELKHDDQDAKDCAALQLMMQQPDKSEETILKYGLEKQKDAQIYYYLGIIEMMRFNPVKAVTWFKTSESIEHNPPALMMLANAYYELNRYELAAEVYRNVLAKNPDNKAAVNGLKRLPKN